MPSETYTLETEAWWVQQWVDLLNTYRFKKRLERGWKYAREGHILSLTFQEAKVYAKVQGTAPEPYELSIWIDSFTDEDWNYIIDTLGAQAIYSAQLLAGEMPANIEEVFTANGLSLFPFTLTDVHSHCDCPDKQNPCKHVAAVYYQLGDFFREDPFVLFQLRGRNKTDILDALRQKRRLATEADAATDADPATDSAEKNTSAESMVTQPMSMAHAIPETMALERFWYYSEPLDPSLVVITPSEQTVLDVLGIPPLPSGDAQTVMNYFSSLYQSVAQQAMMSALS
jgi:uncharacterized Zn finger protein